MAMASVFEPTSSATAGDVVPMPTLGTSDFSPKQQMFF
jgi:hypothetical protein